MRVDESNFEILKKASDITGVDYEIRWFDAENIEGYIDSEGLLTIIEDLIVCVHKKEEELEDLEEDIEARYELRKIDPYDEYGISRSDFF